MERLSPQEKKLKLIQDFNAFNQWEDRYKKLIELGKKLPPLAENEKVDANIVKGCQSQVWIISKKNQDGYVEYTGDSDALISKGLVALVLGIYSGGTPQEILSTPPDFIKELGFETHLSPSRTNGLFSMIKKVVMDAYLFQNKA